MFLWVRLRKAMVCMCARENVCVCGGVGARVVVGILRNGQCPSETPYLDGSKINPLNTTCIMDEE